MNRKPFVPPINLRRQFGNPDKPLWGLSFDEFSSVPRVEYDRETRKAVCKIAKSDEETNRLASSFVTTFKAGGSGRGISRAGALEMIAKTGVLLNEVEEVEVRNGE